MSSSLEPMNNQKKSLAPDPSQECSIKSYRIGTLGLTLFVGKTIGEGTFGKVKMGRHVPTDERV